MCLNINTKFYIVIDKWPTFETYLIVSVIFLTLDLKGILVLLYVASIGIDEGMQTLDDTGAGFLDVFRSDVFFPSH